MTDDGVVNDDNNNNNLNHGAEFIKNRFDFINNIQKPNFSIKKREDLEMRYSTFFLLSILFIFVIWFLGFVFVWPKSLIKHTLKYIGVALRRIKRTIQEIERKTFHISGLIIPVNYHLLLTFVNGFTQFHGIIIVTTGTLFWLCCDLARIYIPFVNRNFPLQSIARERERHHLSGVSYFGIGCWIAIVWFPPRIAITALLFMILGDMSAAVFGISFGKIKIGHKSLEGTVAMFTVCFFIGFNMFWDIHMREYPVVLAAFVASVTELFEPFGINDNLTIPLLSCLTLQFGFQRISTCEEFTDWKQYLDYKVVESLVNEV